MRSPWPPTQQRIHVIFHEAPRLTQGAEHLIGGKVMPVGAHRLQQMERAAHIALDKGPRPLDRAVHMALGRQVQHQVGIGLLHRRCCSRRIGEVHPDGLLRVDGVSRDLDAPLPWWRLGFDGKAVLEARFFTNLPAVLLA